MCVCLARVANINRDPKLKVFDFITEVPKWWQVSICNSLLRHLGMRGQLGRMSVTGWQECNLQTAAGALLWDSQRAPYSTGNGFETCLWVTTCVQSFLCHQFFLPYFENNSLFLFEPGTSGTNRTGVEVLLRIWTWRMLI